MILLFLPNPIKTEPIITYHFHCYFHYICAFTQNIIHGNANWRCTWMLSFLYSTAGTVALANVPAIFPANQQVEIDYALTNKVFATLINPFLFWTSLFILVITRQLYQLIWTLNTLQIIIKKIQTRFKIYHIEIFSLQFHLYLHFNELY